MVESKLDMPEIRKLQEVATKATLVAVAAPALICSVPLLGFAALLALAGLAYSDFSASGVSTGLSGLGFAGLILLFAVPVVLSAVTVCRALHGRIREARPIVTGGFVIMTVLAFGADPAAGWVLAILAVVVAVSQYVGLAGSSNAGPPPLVAAMYRRVGLVAGLLPVALGIGKWNDPILGWLMSIDTAGEFNQNAAPRTILADLGVADGLAKALLDQLGRSGLDGLAQQGATGVDIWLRATPRVHTEHTLGVLTRDGVLTAVAVALVTLAPIVAEVLRNVAGQTGGTTVRIPTVPRIPGRIVRWELGDQGWRGLFTPRILHRLILRDRASIDRPSATRYAAIWPSKHVLPPPQWVEWTKLKVKPARYRFRAVGDLLAASMRGLVVGVTGFTAFAFVLTCRRVLNDYARLSHYAAHFDQTQQAKHLSGDGRLRVYADLLSGMAQIQRTGLTLLAAAAGLVATAAVGFMVLRGRSEPIASDVVAWWGGERRPWFAVGVVDRIRYGSAGWEARVRRDRYRGVLGWFPLADVRRPDDPPASPPDSSVPQDR
jgi:hypothetical protein